MSEYLNRDDVLEVFNDIHPLDYNANAYLGQIKKLPVVDFDTDTNSPNKWISTAERQPEKTGLYLCYTKKRVFLVLNYSKKHNVWNTYDSEDEPTHALEVAFWQPLPEPPEVKK